METMFASLVPIPLSPPLLSAQVAEEASPSSPNSQDTRFLQGVPKECGELKLSITGEEGKVAADKERLR